MQEWRRPEVLSSALIEQRHALGERCSRNSAASDTSPFKVPASIEKGIWEHTKLGPLKNPFNRPYLAAVLRTIRDVLAARVSNGAESLLFIQLSAQGEAYS